MKYAMDFSHDGGGWYVNVNDQWLPISWTDMPEWTHKYTGPLQCSVSFTVVKMALNVTTMELRITDVEPAPVEEEVAA